MLRSILNWFNREKRLGASTEPSLFLPKNGDTLILQSDQQLRNFISELSSQAFKANQLCAIDTESDNLHRYKDSLSLIQFASTEVCVLIDPLTIRDFSPLIDYFSKSRVWMHGADYDMMMLKREFKCLPYEVYDTQIGARLLGVKKFGLANLVHDYFGVELDKSSQKADWGKRPLPARMVEYALDDARYLIPMGEKITEQLSNLDRMDWFIESCKQAKQKVLDRQEDPSNAWRIQGSGNLNSKALAFLKALWYWREEEGKKWDRPVFMVANNKQLLDWSIHLEQGETLKFPNHYKPQRIKRIQETILKVHGEDPEHYPEKSVIIRRKKSKSFDQALAEWLARREKAANHYQIDAALFGARSVFESIVAKECAAEEVLMKWQLKCLMNL